MLKRPDAKSQILREHGTLNPRPQLVSDGLFQDNEFFDPRDLLLVKYEMLRRVRLEERPSPRLPRPSGARVLPSTRRNRDSRKAGWPGSSPNGLARDMPTSCRTKCSTISGNNRPSTNCRVRRSFANWSWRSLAFQSIPAASSGDSTAG